MLSTKIRTIIVTLVASLSVTGVAVVPSVAQADKSAQECPTAGSGNSTTPSECGGGGGEGEAPPGEAPPGEAPPGEAPTGEAPTGEGPVGSAGIPGYDDEKCEKLLSEAERHRENVLRERLNRGWGNPSKGESVNETVENLQATKAQAELENNCLVID